ncbi:hypothetical protein CHLNCDRAFT_133152 [Chlorella variabilis]|uniref:Oxysterol-binding protein n=1 Tax=Chlorella variabilis TaxID=554065 RepID=E1Z2G9_CHLVA|nr:hypothetical protein CHLNCDRAFT_133152 [Chlorella variabilis]EFN59995.1 hypothetical protein CHLNCDRAFT_133152 [Chlorella variabilis]|eukprot:XP_005852097.1 hypothetical protein CHLNCDRAFT_133152 [Chlorella variabilis]
MAEQQQNGEDGGWLSGAWSLGQSIYNAAANTVNSVMGYDDLDVVDPTAGEATSGKEAAISEERAKAFSSYRDYLGKDITSLVILPVWIMQPFTMLQCMGELMEYTDLLDKAAVTEDPYERLAWVVGFTMGPFGTIERPWKPFNPILGETFEYGKPDRGMKYIAEQVSHHPPVGAGHGETELWTYDIVSAPKTKFLGNSVEVYPIGRTRIRLKPTGECAEKPADDPYGFTHFAHTLNSCEGGINPLPSDSRRRPDRALLELGNSSDSAVAKYNLEEMQRAERKEREKRGEKWQPRWFKPLPEDAGALRRWGGGPVLPGEYSNEECPQFEFTGEYLKLEQRPPSASEEEVQGEGFVPWSYPDIHAKLGKEAER